MPGRWVAAAIAARRGPPPALFEHLQGLGCAGVSQSCICWGQGVQECRRVWQSCICRGEGVREGQGVQEFRRVWQNCICRGQGGVRDGQGVRELYLRGCFAEL